MAVTRMRPLFSLLILLLIHKSALALVLEEQRVDALYHSYDGGGVEVSGPSILVRKNIGDNVSVTANHYVDSVSSASVDVVTQASAYSEERTQRSVGIDYLYDKSIMSYSYTTSDESDFEAQTNSFSIKQEMFGGLTTVSLGYTLGNNIVGQSDDPSFRESMNSKGFRISASQVLTKNTILGLGYEIITDEGLLNNPYRSVSYDDGAGGTLFQSEVYPNTRTSNAVSFHLRYYLPHRASVYGGYRAFTDSWGISAFNYDIGYVYPRDDWLYEVSYRFYSQTHADFYDDFFPNVNAQNFLASDKELSTFTDYSINLGASYDFAKDGFGVFEKASVNFYYSYFFFDYENYSDTRNGQAEETVSYDFSASIIRLFLSAWF